MSFENILKKTLEHEGGYSNLADDKGGETFRGIARRLWPAWAGWPLVDEYKKNNNIPEALNSETLLEMIAQFYKNNFWTKCGCNLLPDMIADKIFDTAVNCGTRRAVRWLQAALNLTRENQIAEDGVIGGQTITAVIGARSQEEILVHYRLAQVTFYRDLVLADKTQTIFLLGWIGRAIS